MHRYGLRDDQWDRIKHLLPGQSGWVDVFWTGGIGLGAVAAALEMLSVTVTAVVRLSTDNVMGTSSVPPALICAPERLASENPGAATMIV